jgi:hypothetical protein
MKLCDLFYDLFAQSRTLNEPKTLTVCLYIRVLYPPSALEQKLILVICPNVFGKFHVYLKIRL